jgi:diphthamide synthase subunit DPH2
MNICGAFVVLKISYDNYKNKFLWEAREIQFQAIKQRLEETEAILNDDEFLSLVESRIRQGKSIKDEFVMKLKKEIKSDTEVPSQPGSNEKKPDHLL